MQGENGRSFIKNNLKQKGCKFCVIECYKKVLKNLNGNLEEKKWSFYKINSLVTTSGDILRELNNIILDTNEFKWLFECKVFVVGTRLKKIAKNLGWKDIVVSKYANNKYLLKIINKYRY